MSQQHPASKDLPERAREGDGHRQSARRANDEIAAQALELDVPAETVLAFVCECHDPFCREYVKMTASDYETLRFEGDFLLASGHR